MDLMLNELKQVSRNEKLPVSGAKMVLQNRITERKFNSLQAAHTWLPHRRLWPPSSTLL